MELGIERRTRRAMPRTSSLTSTGRASIGCWREKASRRLISAAPPSAAVWQGATNSSTSGASPRASRSAVRLPITTVSMLLKSCARPPVSSPMASIFCAWASAFWVRRWSVMSTACTKQPMTSPSGVMSGSSVLRAKMRAPAAEVMAYS